jgi:hypothetical protein
MVLCFLTFTRCFKLSFWDLATVWVLLKPRRFGRLFYFRLQMGGGQKPNLLGTLVRASHEPTSETSCFQ